MQYNPGFDIDVDFEHMIFRYGVTAFGPLVERRTLDAIRTSLMDPSCVGPEVVYAIAMDVGQTKDKAALISRNLLYGAVLYAKGQLGEEPIRSQGHIHAVSASCGESTPEVYEIWNGKAIIYMQESAQDQPGRCFAVEGLPGDVIIVPPGWAHSTISADPNQQLVFGAWCVRDYGFEYQDVRSHHGLAYFPILNKGVINWSLNPSYDANPLIIKRPRSYKEFGIERSIPIYTQYEQDPNRFMFVVNPSVKNDVWEHFIP